MKALDYHFTVSVDGQTVVDITDPKINDPSKMSDGILGLYEEDSSASFDNVELTNFPRTRIERYGDAKDPIINLRCKTLRRY